MSDLVELSAVDLLRLGPILQLVVVRPDDGAQYSVASIEYEAFGGGDTVSEAVKCYFSLLRKSLSQKGSKELVCKASLESGTSLKVEDLIDGKAEYLGYKLLDDLGVDWFPFKVAAFYMVYSGGGDSHDDK